MTIIYWMTFACNHPTTVFFRVWSLDEAPVIGQITTEAKALSNDYISEITYMNSSDYRVLLRLVLG